MRRFFCHCAAGFGAIADGRPEPGSGVRVQGRTCLGMWGGQQLCCPRLCATETKPPTAAHLLSHLSYHSYPFDEEEAKYAFPP